MNVVALIGFLAVVGLTALGMLLFSRWLDKTGGWRLTLQEQQQIREEADVAFEEEMMALLASLSLPALEEQTRLREAAHRLSIALARRLENERH